MPPINTFGRDLAKLLNGKANFIVKGIGAEKIGIKCEKLEDCRKAWNILDKVRAPYPTFTLKDEKVPTFFLNCLNTVEPSEVLELLQAKSPDTVSVSRFSTRKSVLEKLVPPRFVQMNPVYRELGEKGRNSSMPFLGVMKFADCNC